MNIAETIGDIDAIRAEIHDRVTEQADQHDFDEGVAMRDCLTALVTEAQAAIALIEQTMLSQLEAGAQQRGTRLFKRKRNTVKRFRHDLIEAGVQRFARREAADANGEVSVTKALDIAMIAMRKIYVSPSTPAKVGALDTYEIERKTVLEFEDKGWRLEVEELDARQD